MTDNNPQDIMKEIEFIEYEIQDIEQRVKFKEKYLALYKIRLGELKPPKAEAIVLKPKVRQKMKEFEFVNKKAKKKLVEFYFTHYINGPTWFIFMAHKLELGLNLKNFYQEIERDLYTHCDRMHISKFPIILKPWNNFVEQLYRYENELEIEFYDWIGIDHFGKLFKEK